MVSIYIKQAAPSPESVEGAALSLVDRLQDELNRQHHRRVNTIGHGPNLDLAWLARYECLLSVISAAEGYRHWDARTQVEEVIAVEAFRFRGHPYVAGEYVALQRKRRAVASLNFFHAYGRAMQTKMFVIHEIESFAVDQVSILKQLHQQHDLGWIMSVKQFLGHSAELFEKAVKVKEYPAFSCFHFYKNKNCPLVMFRPVGQLFPC